MDPIDKIEKKVQWFIVGFWLAFRLSYQLLERNIYLVHPVSVIRWVWEK